MNTASHSRLVSFIWAIADDCSMRIKLFPLFLIILLPVKILAVSYDDLFDIIKTESSRDVFMFDGGVTNFPDYTAYPSDSALINNVVMSSQPKPFTLAHEIGHVLTNDYHYGTDYHTESSSFEVALNLMRSGTSSQNSLTASKRLTQEQEFIIFSNLSE